MDARYLRVKNWSRYQHYAKRRPPWIKLYNDLIGDGDEFEHLAEADQWQLVRIWMVASKSSRFTLDEDEKIVPVVPDDERAIRRSIQTLRKVPLAMFIREGWLLAVAEEELIIPDEHPNSRQNASTALANGHEIPVLIVGNIAPPASALLEPENQRTREDQPPEQNQEDDRPVAALVDISLGKAPQIQPLIDVLPPNEVKANTAKVLQGKFAALPAHFVGLAREELLAAQDVRSPVRYLNGIADRMLTEQGRRPAA